MSRTIQERAAVGPLAVLDGTGDTHKLGFEHLAGDANNCVAVATHIHKGNVRRQIGVG